MKPRPSLPLAAAVTLCLALTTGCVPPTSTPSVTGSDTAPDTVSPWITPTVTGSEATPDAPVGPGGSTPPRGTEVTPSGAAQGCQESVADLVAAPIPRGHDWTEVRYCQEDTAWDGRDGLWQVRIDRTAASGFDALIAALEQPDAPSNPDEPCPAVTAAPEQPSSLVLIDRGGGSFLPRIPRGECGWRSADYSLALETMSWTTMETTDLYQIRSQAQIDAGCYDRSTPLVTLVANYYQPGWPGYPSDQGYTTARICRYDLDPDPLLATSDPSGQVHPGGRFASAGTLSDDEYNAFMSAVAQAPWARECDLPDGPWAEVRPPSAVWKLVYAELGGCNRALIYGEGNVRQLEPAMVALLQ